jgi:adenylosuccinate lyase
LIERYSPPRMRQLWSDDRRFRLWLQIEVLACEAWAELGRVPVDALPRIRRATVDPERVKEVEAAVGHDLVAFLTVAGESIGADARHLHLGLTSSDVVDTAFALQLKEAGELLLEDLGRLREVAVGLAVEHRRTLMAGRTHGMHAEPTTFGFKVAGWVAELDRDAERLETATAGVAVGKLSGAVGTHATIDARVETSVMSGLGLGVDPVSTQVVSRDRHAAFMTALAVTAGTLERIATELRHLQRSEVSETQEPFGREQKGSSAMPHKRNPVLSERVTGLARVVRGYAATALENMALWHERDISHSSAERVIFPDACALVDYMLQQLTTVLTGLVVSPERMARNLDRGGGVVYSQRVLLALVDSGMARDEAYRLVQAAAHRALDAQGSFKELIAAEPEVRNRLGGDRLDALFDPAPFLEQIDLAFDRLNLGVNA